MFEHQSIEKVGDASYRVSQAYSSRFFPPFYSVAGAVVEKSVTTRVDSTLNPDVYRNPRMEISTNTVTASYSESLTSRSGLN